VQVQVLMNSVTNKILQFARVTSVLPFLHDLIAELKDYRKIILIRDKYNIFGQITASALTGARGYLYGVYGKLPFALIKAQFLKQTFFRHCCLH
jgi:hypothetical protein